MAEFELTLRDVLERLGLGHVDQDSVSAPQAKEWLTTTSSITFPGSPLEDESPTAPFHKAHSVQVLVNVVQHFVKGAAVVELPASATGEALLLKFVGTILAHGTAEQQGELRNVVVLNGVEMHYLASAPAMFDIFAHLSANEMFFVDGDSLLMYALSNYRVDWDLVQPLHVLFLAHKLLAELHARQARFHVVFFDDHEWIWSKSPVKRYLRAVLHQGLTNAQKSNAELVVATFASSASDEFASYVARFEPEFVLMTDGENLMATPKQLKRYSSDPESFGVLDDPIIGRAAAFLYRAFGVRIMAQRTQVVFISRLVFKDNAMIAFVAQPSSERFMLCTQLAESCRLVSAYLAEPFKHLVKEAKVSPDDDAAIDEALNDPAKLLSTHRLCIIVASIRTFLKERANASTLATDVAIAQALVVSVVAMDFLTAEERAQPAADAPVLAQFLRDLAPHMLAWLTYFGVSGAKSKEWDTFDGHLLYAVTKVLAKESPAVLLPDGDLAFVNDLWSIVTDSKKQPFGSDVLANMPVLADPESAPIVPRATNVSHPLTAALHKAFPSSSFSTNTAPSDRVRSHAALTGWLVEEAFVVWNDVLNEGELKDGRGDEVYQERRSKVNTKFATHVKETAESLDQLSFLFANEGKIIVQDQAATTQQRQKQSYANHQKKKQKTSAELIVEANELRRAVKSLSDAQETVTNLLAKKDALLAQTVVSPEDRASLLTTIERAELKVPLANGTEDVDKEKLHKAWRSFCGDAMSERGKVLQLTNFDAVGVVAKKMFAQKASAPEFYQEEDLTEEIAIRALQKKFCAVFKAHGTFQLKTAVVAVLLVAWKDEKLSAKQSFRKANTDLATSLFVAAQKALSFLEHANICPVNAELEILRAAVVNLDFPEAYVKLVDGLILQWTGLTSLTPLPVVHKSPFNLLGLSSTQFQMCLMGHLLERPVNRADDRDRVPFKPDQWQRDLLDIIDERGSAVVCAPTSAGKTFISYYCMRQVLRSSNTDMVVYVAPTRALVNQALADAKARYGSKNYPANQAYEVVGVAERPDYVINHTSCQVLVTIPEVLETLLLSPKYVEWSKRLKYVIFDEIHTIESSGNGAVWERLLALVQCPFVALSATLDKTEALVGWLQRVQDRIKAQHTRDNTLETGACAYTVSLIPKPATATQPAQKIQRWNDIMKWIYLPPVGCHTSARKLSQDFPFEHIKPLMPLSCVTIEAMREKFPPDLTLVPSECYELFNNMTATFNSVLWKNYSDVPAVQAVKQSLRQLDPEVYFANLRYITQNKAREYERDIKKELQEWAAMANRQTLPAKYDFSALDSAGELDGFCLDVTDVVNTVLGGSRKILQKTEADLNTVSPPYVSLKFIQSHMLNVLHELKSRGLGPTIVFSFDSEVCMQLAESVVVALEIAEEAYRKTDEFLKWEASQKAKKATQDQLLRSKASQQLRSIDRDENGNVVEQTQEAIQVDESEDYSIPDVLPEFTFVGRSKVEAMKLQEILKDCDQGADLLRRAFKRGIAVHHAGIAGKLRIHAEKLFRMMHCNVIFATETLALGIHSPCRSVVLAGDHVLLNTTQFRQMMGRAGRRGLDFLGHLVFLSITSKKIDRLMTSDLTVIRGHQAVDPITELRLLQLHDYDDHHEDKGRISSGRYASDAAERLFVDPLFELARRSYKGPSIAALQIDVFQQVTQHFMQLGLYSLKSESMIGHLATVMLHIYAQPCSGTSALFFSNLLAEGAFHSAHQQTCELLAYVFTKHRYFDIPLEVHRSLMLNPDIVQVKATSRAKSHNVALPPLTELPGVPAVVTKLQRDLCAMLSAFVVHHQQYVPQVAPRLPYSVRNKSKQPFAVFADQPADDIPLVERLRNAARPAVARDPFIAITGAGDSFDSVDDLCRGLRPGLFVDRAMVPILDFTDLHNHDRAQLIISAAVPDFIACGAQVVNGEYTRDWLQRFNGLTQSDSYSALSHFRHLCHNLNVQKPQATSSIQETLRLVRPENDTDIAARSILDVCERVSKLENQIDNRAWLDRLLMQNAKDRKEKELQKAQSRRGQ